MDTAEPSSKSKWRRNLPIGLLVGSSIALTCGLLAVRFVVLSYWTTPHRGMYPTLAAGSTFFAFNRPYKGVGDVKRGDIVVFEQFQEDGRYFLIWRVVALPGDAVEVDPAGALSLDGRALPAEKVRPDPAGEIVRETNHGASYLVVRGPRVHGPPETFRVTVPPGHLFLLGDNRPGASDGRRIGPIPFESVVARKW